MYPIKRHEKRWMDKAKLQIHKLCQQSAQQILNEFRPDYMIAIAGGGYIPARILRTFLKRPGAKNIPIQAIGLVLYEDHCSGSGEVAGKEVVRTQWLDFSTLSPEGLIGKRILIVDEVDDSRRTLHYAVTELGKDISAQAEKMGREEETVFGVFVVHNKDKEKVCELPGEVMQSRYWAGETTGDQWICYPWEATDIDDHEGLATAQENIAG
ncbi:Xanthine phosphoribosyltransferase 1 [Neolecta irregularis DAH-3]|uniref:Xanthine phosphoribosyltransferase 1 n=1 Tax=Neolecta irregularis (strain DAH-3) TaxID=1198029 RepID=A0A1U7LKF0_NEOID|nr:Xanthine phosphoribosyltransferase 1 [Neolecta irregularis DAH-3]|eukprot:OLL23022.1 Xanthine phosphoribosyltransferase 1 [Neolecta irregularis DAH-3]